MISLASITFASFGLRPPSISRFSAAISSIDLKLSRSNHFHICRSLIDRILANMLLAGSVMPT